MSKWPAGCRLFVAKYIWFQIANAERKNVGRLKFQPDAQSFETFSLWANVGRVSRVSERNDKDALTCVQRQILIFKGVDQLDKESD